MLAIIFFKSAWPFAEFFFSFPIFFPKFCNEQQQKKMFHPPTVLLSASDWTLEGSAIKKEVADGWYKAFLKLPLREKPLFDHMTRNGKQTRAHRDVAFFSDVNKSYTISKTEFEPLPLTPELKQLLESVNTEFGECYNAVIVNRYNDGFESIGPHSDNPKALGKKGVVTLSFGETRICRIRPKQPHGDPQVAVMDVECSHGTILNMFGTFQEFFTHEIVSEEYEQMSSRISVTCRWMK